METEREARNLETKKQRSRERGEPRLGSKERDSERTPEDQALQGFKSKSHSPVQMDHSPVQMDHSPVQMDHSPVQMDQAVTSVSGRLRSGRDRCWER